MIRKYSLFSNLNVLVLSFSMFLLITGFYMFIPVFPLYLKESKHLTISQLGLITSAYSISRLVFQAPLGSLSDRIGKKKMVTLAMLGYSVSSILFLLSTSVEHFFSSRLLYGVSSAALLPATAALLMDVTTKEKRGEAFGFYRGFSNAGMLLGPFAGGVLLAWFGYDIIFIIAAILAIFSSLSVFVFLKETRVYKESNNEPKNEEVVKKSRNLGFSRITLKQFGLLVLPVGVIYFINSFGFYLFQPFFPVYLSSSLLISSTLIGLIFSIGNAVPLIFSIPLGKFSDKIRKRKPFIVAGLAIIAFSMFSVVLCKDFYQIVVVITINSIGVTLYYFAMPAYIGDMTSDKRGAFMGIVGTIGEVGGLSGSIIGGLVWDAYGPLSTFYLNATITILACIIVFTFLHENSRSSEHVGK